MKKQSFGLAFLITLLVFSFLLPTVSAFAEDATPLPSHTAARTVYLYNFENNEEILVKNRKNKIAPASTAKIASGLLAMDLLSNRLDEVITITEDMLSVASGAKLGLEIGDRMSIRELLYCAICGGNNDAVCALAYLSCGSEEAFVTLLNERLAAWGCQSTHYTNATGMDATGMYTTLEDVVILSKVALESELYMDISSTKSYTYRPRNKSDGVTVHNRNAIISPYYYQNCQSRYARGLIAGMTDQGGYCVVTYAEYEGSRFLCIVMGAGMAGSMPASFDIAFNLLQYCYTQRLYTQVGARGQEVCRIPVSLALSADGKDQATLPCVLEDDLFALIPDDKDVSALEFKPYFHKSTLEAPVAIGEVVGGVNVYDGDRWIGHSRLIVSEGIDANPILSTLADMRSLFFSRAMVISYVSAAVLLTGYATIVYRKKKKRDTQYRQK